MSLNKQRRKLDTRGKDVYYSADTGFDLDSQ